jgi:hypothetical protein
MTFGILGTVGVIGLAWASAYAAVRLGRAWLMGAMVACALAIAAQVYLDSVGPQWLRSGAMMGEVR